MDIKGAMELVHKAYTDNDQEVEICNVDGEVSLEIDGFSRVADEIVSIRKILVLTPPPSIGSSATKTVTIDQDLSLGWYRLELELATQHELQDPENDSWVECPRTIDTKNIVSIFKVVEEEL